MKSKFFTLLTLLLCLCSSGAWAQGSYGITSGAPAVAAGTKITSVANITMTYGVTGGADFKAATDNTTLQSVLGATALTEGNGENGTLTTGTVYYFAPAKNGTLTVGFVLNNGKSFYVKTTGGTDVSFSMTNASGVEVKNSDNGTFVNGNTVSSKLTGGLVTFTVAAGTTYAVYCTGSKLGYYGFKYEVAAADKPTISTQPQSATYAVGATAEALTVEASASAGELSYQWYSNTDGDTTAKEEDKIDGATSATLASAKISTASAGVTYYYCVVSDTNGSVTSSKATITVVDNSTITYAIGDGTGLVPAAQTVANGTVINLPKNFTMYKAGYTMTGWDADGNGTADYTPGQSYTVTADKTLTAVYAENTVTLDERTSSVDILFDFRRDNGAPIVSWQFADATHYWIAQASVNGETIDVPMTIRTYVDGTGKFSNTGNTDCTQVTNNTEFDVPSRNGATIEMECHGSFTISTTTIDGSTDYTGTGGTKISYSVTSDNDPVHIVIGDGSYYKYVKVTLPAPPSVSGDVTFVSSGATTGQVLLDLDERSGNNKLSVTNSPITVAVANDNSAQIRVSSNKLKLSSGAKLTISGTNALITKVVFEADGTGFTLSPAEDESTTYEYSVPQPTITLTNGGSNLNISKITVSYIDVVAITPANDWSTYVATADLDFSGVVGGDLKAYVATQATAGKVKLEEVTTAPEGTPLLLIGTASTEYFVPKTLTASVPETNMFRAGDGETVFNGTTYDYLLFTDKKFYQITSGTIATNKAYLHCDSDPTAGDAARSLTIDFDDDELTGIKSIESSKLQTAGEYYDLSGRRVAQPTKGLYIVNGKKVVIK